MNVNSEASTGDNSSAKMDIAEMVCFQPLFLRS